MSLTQSATAKTQREGNTKTSLKSRKWCFTLNNYIDSDIDTLTQHFLNKKYKYIFGKEIGKINLTPHLQGFIESENAIRFETLKKLLPTAHFEIAKGTVKDNFQYCSKENDYYTNITDLIKKKKELSETQKINRYIEKVLEDCKERIKVLGMTDEEWYKYIEP